MSTSDHRLVVVIPYYKLRYFEAALESLARQSHPGFDVFIGDDASPESPAAVLEKYRDKLRLTYHRFDENMGRDSLPNHWTRCVEKTTAPWVWLFSDDDVADPQCVEAFLKALADSADCDVYRFNTKVVDASGQVTINHPTHPEFETAEQFAFAKLSEGRNSCAIEYIFRRQAFDSAGGFVDFPLAWCSDDASWMRFSRRTGIRTVTKGLVYWRQSGLNLSSPDPRRTSAKLDAWRQYFLWMRREFTGRDFQKKYRQQLTSSFLNWVKWSGERPDLLIGVKFWLFFAVYTRRVNLRLLRNLLR